MTGTNWKARRCVGTVALLFLVLGSAPRLWPQVTVGYVGALPIAVSVDAMQDELAFSSPQQRQDLLERLGVDAPLARDASKVLRETGIQVQPLEGTSKRLLFLPCAGPGGETAHLFLLLPVTHHAWHVGADAPLDCWYENSTFQLLFLGGHRIEAVLAHHVNHGHGTGYVQNDMVLFEVKGGHLEPMLTTAEYKLEDTMGESKTTEQQSTLQPFPDGSLEETRATTERTEGEKDEERTRLTTVERRRWRFDPSTGRFSPEPFRAVR